MSVQIVRRSLLGAALALPALRPAAAQEAWPARPVRLLIPFPPGQATDTIARVLAEALSAKWPQRVVVENRAGGAGVVGTEAGARAAPDGYTLVASTSGTNGINPSVIRNLPYDAERDFNYVTLIFTVPLMIVAHPSFAPNDIAGLIAAAKADPGGVSYGSGGPGTSQHMSAELFCARAGVRLTHVPYRGSGPAMADLLAGNIPMMFDSVASALPHIRGGRIKALGVTSAARAPQLPEVPAIAEAIPGYEAIGWAGIAVPAGTPEAVVNRVNADVTALLRDPALAARVEELQRYRSDFFGRLRDVLGDRPEIRIAGDRFVFQSEVLFPIGSADLSDAGREQIGNVTGLLLDIARRIPEGTNWVLRVDGHADNSPIRSPRYATNWELSSARAIAVAQLMIQNGLPANRVAATAFGEFQPLDTADTPAARARNRRIELRLTDR